MKVPAKVHGVVFDLDGTLLDTLDDIRIVLNRVLVAHGFPMREREEIARAVGDGARNLVARAMCVEPTDLRVDVVLARYLVEYEEDPTPATRPMPGVIELLDGLASKGVRSAVCTNKPRAVARAVIARMLPKRFDAVIAAQDAPRLKPEPDPILAALVAMNVRNDEAAMVGDGAQDIVAARAAGVFSIGCAFGYGGEALRAAKPDAIVDRLQDVLDVLGMAR